MERDWIFRVIDNNRKTDFNICKICFWREQKGEILLFLQSNTKLDKNSTLVRSTNDKTYNALLLDENNEDIAYLENCTNFEYSILCNFIVVKVEKIENITDKFDLLNELKMEFKYKELINEIEYIKKSDSI